MKVILEQTVKILDDCNTDTDTYDVEMEVKSIEDINALLHMFITEPEEITIRLPMITRAW